MLSLHSGCLLQEGGSAKHALQLADVHMTLGDISQEKGDFETAVGEYDKCETLLKGVQPLPIRRWVGLRATHMERLFVVLSCWRSKHYSTKGGYCCTRNSLCTFRLSIAAPCRCTHVVHLHPFLHTSSSKVLPCSDKATAEHALRL
jgi:hypothetical protein